MICKYPPIQGGVSADNYWLAQQFAENGHKVSVVTNANEVESRFRIHLSEEDTKKLTGFRKKNSVSVHSTEIDPAHLYIPQNNPSISKMVSTALEVIQESRADFIYSSYLEPYGVVAYFVSLITGIPFTFRHAGSDIGRLLQSDALRNTYIEVLKKASAILTSDIHHERFETIGISKERLVQGLTIKMPGDVFYPEDRVRTERLTIGVYGKTGKAKGTYKLLKVIALLKEQGQNILLRAHWEGRDVERIKERILEYGIEDSVEIMPYTAPWNIPSFIRSCDFMVALENHFSVTFHTPSLPMEVWSCGRHILMTEEVAQKTYVQTYVKDSESCLVIPTNFDVEMLCKSIMRMKGILSASTQHIEVLDASLLSFSYPEQAEHLLERIIPLLK